MLRVLMESQAKHQRRGGGAALSVAVHLAIIGAVAVTTVRGATPPTEKARPVTLTYVPPVAVTPVMRPTSTSTSASAAPRLSVPTLPRISVPTIVPTSLPPIDAARGFSVDSITAPVERGVGGDDMPRGLSVGDERGESSALLRGSELLMHIVTPAKPRYPESLRQAGVDGHVLVRFVVDTAGRVDLSTVQFLSSTHDLFSRAVRDALGNFRFVPAQVGGRKVAALAEMPFDFQISR